MAESDSERLQALLNDVRTDSKAVEQLFERIAQQDALALRPPVEILDPEPKIERAAELQKGGAQRATNCGESGHTGWSLATAQGKRTSRSCGAMAVPGSG